MKKICSLLALALCLLSLTEPALADKPVTDLGPDNQPQTDTMPVPGLPVPPDEAGK